MARVCRARRPLRPSRPDMNLGGRGGTGWAKMGDFPPDARPKGVPAWLCLRCGFLLFDRQARSVWGAVELARSPTEGPSGVGGGGNTSSGAGDAATPDFPRACAPSCRVTTRPAERTKWGRTLGARREGGRGAPFCSGHSFLQRKRPGYLEGRDFIREDLPRGEES